MTDVDPEFARDYAPELAHLTAIGIDLTSSGYGGEGTATIRGTRNGTTYTFTETSVGWFATTDTHRSRFARPTIGTAIAALAPNQTGDQQ